MLEICPVSLIGAFPGGSDGEESACNVGDLGPIPKLGRSPGEGKGYPLQYSGLENSMDSVVRGVAKSWTRLSDFTLYCIGVFLSGLLHFVGASLVAQKLKHLPGMRETWV